MYNVAEVKEMDMRRKKELLEEYRNRRPEMGVVSFRCIATGESFMGSTKDTKAYFNSERFKLLSGGHPNRQFQEIWNKHGEEGFEVSVLKTLKYDDPKEDHREELEELLDQCLQVDSMARRIWT